MDLTLLRHGRSALALALSVISSVVTFAAVFLLPVFTQSVQRHSAFATGLALLPQCLITGVGILGSLLAARALHVGAVAAFHEIGLILVILATAATLFALRLPARTGEPRPRRLTAAAI